MPSGVGTKYFLDTNGNAEVHRGEKHCKHNTRQGHSKNKTDPTLRNCTEGIRIRSLLPTVRSVFLFSSSYVIPDLWRPPAFPKQPGQISPQVSLLPEAEGLGRNVEIHASQYQAHTMLGIPSWPLRGRATVLGLHETGHNTFPYIVTIWAPNGVKK